MLSYLLTASLIKLLVDAVQLVHVHGHLKVSASSVLILRLPRKRAIARPLVVSRQLAADNAKAGLHGVRLVHQLELDDLRYILAWHQGGLACTAYILRRNYDLIDRCRHR